MRKEWRVCVADEGGPPDIWEVETRAEARQAVREAVREQPPYDKVWIETRDSPPWTKVK